MYRDKNRNEKCPGRVDARSGHKEKINGKAGLPHNCKRHTALDQVFRVLLLIENTLVPAGLCLLALEIATAVGGWA